MTTNNDQNSLRKRIFRIGALGWLLFGLSYALIFGLFTSNGVLSALQRALINTVPAALIGWPVARIVQTQLVAHSTARQVVGHLLLSLGFALLWYIGVQVGYGLRDGWMQSGLSGRPLIGIAIAWQSFQSITLYAVVALFAYAAYFRLELETARTDIARLQSAQTQTNAAPRQVLVKDGRKLRPVPVADIIALSGAGDYTEVHTRDGAHLSSTTLTGFEAELPGVLTRVHRSHLVRMGAVIGVEPAGNGRLSLHLPGGLSIVTSRDGARRVRDRAL